MFLPSRPIILPFLSSLGREITETVFSATCSAAYLWIVVARISVAIFLLSAFTLSSASLLAYQIHEWFHF